MLSPIWFIDGSSSDVLRFFQICQTRLSSTTSEPIAIAKSLHITETGWNAFVYGIKVPSTCPLIQNIPQILSLTSFTEVISVFQSCFECSGNTDDRFVQMCQLRKGQFLSVKKTIVAFLHSNSEGHATVRHVSCEILVNSEGVSCSVCKDYRNRLRAMHSSFIKSNSKATCVNIRYLSTPKRKVRVNSLRSKVKNSRNALNRVKRQLKELTRASGVEVDEQLKTDIMTVIDKHQEINGIKPDAFQRVFWEQQIAAAKVKAKQAVRWHPVFIRWCLNIMLNSPKTYNIIRESGVLSLPSTRTLKDYSNWFKSEAGFQDEVFTMLYEDYNIPSLNLAQR
jgi:hypothetical protein